MKGLFDKCIGFDWDKGNSLKNWERHQVTQGECEQVFFNEPFIIFDDKKHSQSEQRWYLMGKTDTDRPLFLVITIKENLIRVISARDMNKKERKVYNEQTKKNTSF